VVTAGNTRLVYAIVKNRTLFHALAALDLPTALAKQQASAAAQVQHVPLGLALQALTSRSLKLPHPAAAPVGCGAAEFDAANDAGLAGRHRHGFRAL